MTSGRLLLILLPRYTTKNPPVCYLCGIWTSAGETDNGDLPCHSCQEKVDKHILSNFRVCTIKRSFNVADKNL